MRIANYPYPSGEFNINELGKELDNYKKKMQQFIPRFLLQIEAVHLFELKDSEALSLDHT
jgi:hypothetical protein